MAYIVVRNHLVTIINNMACINDISDISQLIDWGIFWKLKSSVFFLKKYIHPKDPWTLQWKVLNLYTTGPGSQNRHF